MHATLLSKLAELKGRTARFRRVAFHLHSPDSKDWPREGSDNVRNARSRFSAATGPQEFAGELRQHLELAAITDHMRCEFATKVSAEVGSNDEFIVLPGMEVNFRPEAALGCARIHLLVILPQGSPKECFERLFACLPGIPANDTARTGSHEVTGVSLRQWVERVHGENGICIAAHVDNSQGVRRLFRQTSRETLKLFSDADSKELEQQNEIGDALKNYLFQSNLDAVEVAKTTDGPYYRWFSTIEGKTCWIPTTLTFDAHSVEEFAKSDRITHVKMTRLGLAGLKSAFEFPDTRIRFPDNLPSPPSPTLLGIQVIGDARSFFGEVTVALTENLNCLIGARGSGKSTVVEALRYVFGYNRTLGELEKLQTTIRDMQRANLVGCLIRVVYRTSSGDERVLEATFDEKSDYVTKVYTKQGEFINVADVEACGDYPLRLFGWSEIETLGRSPARQRDLLDRLVAELGPKLRERAELRKKLKASLADVRKAIQDTRSAFERSDCEIRRFKEYKTDFEKLNTPEVKGLFAALDLAQSKRHLLAQVLANAGKQVQELITPNRLDLRTGIDTLLERADQNLRDWWLSEELQRLGIAAVEQDVQGLINQAVDRLRAFSDLVQQHISAFDTQIEKVHRKLREQLAADASMQKVADLRTNAEKRLRRVTGLRDDYQKAWGSLLKTLEDRENVADQLVGVQNQIAGIRAKHNRAVEETLNRFFTGAMRVSIDFRAGGDVEEFCRTVVPLLSGAKRYKARRLEAVVGRHYTPISFARLFLRDQMSDLVGKGEVVGDMTAVFSDEDVNGIWEKAKPFDRDDHAEVEVLAEGGSRLEAILKLQETDWDDYETILLDGRPVNEKSPGQRSSAMLPLIALAETTPLVIDQPEDNLDKRLIGNVMVKVLAELKEKRQIVVCTHDPNILVCGDAEQVIVLDAESDRRGRVALHGSIDNDDIVDTVVDLLEGGDAAFEARRKRYEGRAAHPIGG